MHRNRKWVIGVIVAVLLVGVAGGIYLINSIFAESIDGERKNQLKELTTQVRDTFGNALSFNQSYVTTAMHLFEEGQYPNAEAVSRAAGEISGQLDTGEDGVQLVFIDQNGYCYDAEGGKGIWGDFDQIAGSADSYTFIADSVTYDGTQWAFAETLDTPVVTEDGSATISYAVLLCPIESLSGYYISESYEDSGETYILKENGTRMYDSVEPGDTIDSYNVYKALRASEGTYGEQVDDVLENLQDDGVASGIYVKDGQKYCYSLAWNEQNQVVILYLVPAKLVASDTMSMVTSMSRVLVLFSVLLVIFLCVSVYVVTRTNNDRRMLAQKEKSMKDIEDMNVRLRTMNESLNDANKAAQSALAVAESANRAKSSFLSNMSHDIRTPLNAILGLQKLMDASLDDREKIAEYSGKIAVAGNHLLSLINDILDMSRIESGKTTLNTAPFALNKLVSELQTLMTTQAEAKHQTLTVENTAGDLFLVGDSARLNQILTNLLSNAVKYTQEGGTIEFRAQRVPTQNPHMVLIRFVVRDNGMGMAEEFQKRIFEPFTREESTLINGITGTGLGMSITKNLVDLMGGIIMVESRKGEGSTFTVELSFRRAENEERPETADAGAELKDILRGCHFLMAEDTAINAEILKSLLEMEGATCDIACNGKEASEMFIASAPGTYTAILMDVQMPIMDGYGATRAIRASTHPEAATIPIAALTANAFAEDVQRALEAGMNTHISKPVDMKKLKEFVASI